MPDELTQEQTNKLMDFRRSWLQAADDDNPDDFESSNNKMGKIVNAIRGKWSGLEPDFLLEPILQILLERQSELQSDDLEIIQQKLIESLSLKKSQDDNFKNQLDEYLETNKVNAKNHPLLSGFLPPEPPEPKPPDPTQPTPLRLYVVLGLGAVGCVFLGILIQPILIQVGVIPPPVPTTSPSNSPSKSDILALCDAKTYQGNAEYYISCGSKDLKDFSKKSLTEMDKIIQDLDKEFDFNKKAVLEERASTLIALNNAKILRDLQSNKLKSEDIYPIAAVVPKTGIEGAVYAENFKYVGKRMLAGIAFKQRKNNETDAQKKRLLIIIADDQNNVERGQVIAKKLIQITQILGVVGPYSSSRYYHVYQKYDGKLTVISPSVTTAKSDFQDMEKLQEQGQKFTCTNKEEIEGIAPKFFFRPVGDTEDSTIATLDYLKKHGITKLIVFVQTDDLYSCSLLRRLDAKVKESKHGVSIYKQIFLDGEQEGLSGAVEKLTKDSNLKKENTAILYFQGAFTDKSNADLSKLSNVIEANKDHFLFVGSNPVRQIDKIKNDSKHYGNILIIQPWFPSSPKPKEVEEQENFWKYDSNSDNFVTWNYVMAYDATQMFLYAINQFVNNNKKYPTREGINEILAGTTVQNPGCNKNVEGITGDTFTDNITLDGSDRCPPGGNNGYALIQFDPNLKQWKKAD